jgi:sec-independent protein translocase protein TatA
MLGSEDLILILGVAMLLFGASKLPELARSMGSSMGEFKKAQKESELSLRNFEKSINEPTASMKTKVQETAEKLEIDIRGKTDDQLLDEIQRLNEKPKEISEP